MADEDFGIGGIIRYYSTSDETRTDIKTSYSYWGLGPIARFHFPNKKFDFSFGTGLILGAPSGKVEPKTGTNTKVDASIHMMPVISMGILYKLTGTVALGFDSTRYLTLGSQINGWLQQDYMLKARFSF